MADYVVKGESLTAVADAIREKTGETDALGLGEMPGKVEAVFEAGKKSEYDAFWDAYQQNGERVHYGYAFAGNGWTDVGFKPKYDMTPTQAFNMFAQSGSLDLVACCDARGVTLSFENCTSFDGAFAWSGVTRLGVIDTRKIATTTNIFYGCSSLHTVQKLILKEDGTQSIGTNPFYMCKALENITVEGKIGYGFSFSYSTKLTHASLMSIINALKDYSGSGETYTVILGAENLAKLTDEEKMIAVGKGWVLAGWTPPGSWQEGDECPLCGGSTGSVLDANGRCSRCGYSAAAGKRICTCDGTIDDSCQCDNCGKIWHSSDGPRCDICGVLLYCDNCGDSLVFEDYDTGGFCPSCSAGVSYCENCGSAISEDLGGCTNPECPASPYYDDSGDDSGMEEPEVDTSEYTVQGSSHVIDSWVDENGETWGFRADPGYFWCDAGVNFAIGDVISFAGDDSGKKYVVTDVYEDVGQGYEYAVHFAGTYTPAFGDTVTKWLKP